MKSWLLNTYWVRVNTEWRCVYKCDSSETIGFWQRLVLMWKYRQWLVSTVHYGPAYIVWLKQETPFQKYIKEKYDLHHTT